MVLKGTNVADHYRINEFIVFEVTRRSAVLKFPFSRRKKLLPIEDDIIGDFEFMGKYEIVALRTEPFCAGEIAQSTVRDAIRTVDDSQIIYVGSADYFKTLPESRAAIVYKAISGLSLKIYV